MSSIFTFTLLTVMFVASLSQVRADLWEETLARIKPEYKSGWTAQQLSQTLTERRSPAYQAFFLLANCCEAKDVTDLRAMIISSTGSGPNTRGAAVQKILNLIDKENYTLQGVCSALSEWVTKGLQNSG